MNNRVSLYEYLVGSHSVSEKRQVFYSIFEQMHRFHNNGFYFPKLSFQTISVCFTNPTDIHFSCYEKLGQRSFLEIANLKYQDILKLSQMMVCSFLDDYDYSTPCVCVSVLIEQFDSLASFLLKEDYFYFEKVFLKHESLYYDDYIEMIGDTTFIRFEGKNVVSESEQAFTTYLLLSINLIVVLLIFSCIFLYLQ